MATVTVRLDENMKREATNVASYFGFDLSAVTRAFYSQMIRERRVPLSISEPIPNSETLREIEYGQAVLDGKIKAETFDSAEDLLAAAGA